MSNDPNRPNAKPAHDTHTPGKDSDELSHILEQVDSQLSALRKMRDERDQRMLEIAQRETELTAAAEQLEARRRDLEAQQQGIETIRRELGERNEQVAAREAELTNLSDALANERGDLDAQAASVSAERDRLEALAAQLAAREAAAEKHVAQFKRLADEAAEKAEAAQNTARSAQDAIESLQREVEVSASAFKKVQQELEEKLQHERRAAADHLARLEQEFQARDQASAHAHQERVSHLEHELDEANRQAESLRDQIAQLDEQARALADRAQRSAELERKVAQREQQLAQLVQAVSEYEAEIDRLSAGGTKDAAAIDDRLAQRDERIKHLESQVAQAGAELASREQRIAELSGDASRADTLQQEVLKRDQAIKELESRIAQSDARVEELQESLKDQTPAGARKEADKLRHELARRDEAIRTLHTRLEQASAANAGGGGPPGVTGQELQAIERRRQRLAAYRDALREKTAKLAKAKKTIEARYAQLQQASDEARQLEEMRRAIALERAGLERTERRVRKAQARSNAWTLLASMAVTLATLGLGCWWGVGQFVKPTYLAHTTVGVDPSVELESDQLRAWQEFHESLLTDPKLLGMAAERMGRRGVETLANAGDLDWYLKENLDLTSQGAGEMTLTLKGEGGARTERILSTLATAIIGLSADTRDLRADQTAASIIEPIKVDATPIEDPRLAVFGAVFGAAAALTLFAGVVFSRKLASSKDAFEEAMAQPEVEFEAPNKAAASTADDSVPPHGTITGGPPVRRPV